MDPSQSSPPWKHDKLFLEAITSYFDKALDTKLEGVYETMEMMI
jgi:hypothetical protein